jgi:ParB/RepB/Spo0J family partition protein
MQVSGHIQSSVAPAIVDASLENINTSTTAKPAAKPLVAALAAVAAVEAPAAAPSAAPLESATVADQDAENQKARLDFIKIKFIVRGNNPRTYFDPKELADLTESVRVQGINQPILVRPMGDGTYEIIAGERRYRAALAAHGEEFEMPVMIREVSASQARILANIENTQLVALQARFALGADELLRKRPQGAERASHQAGPRRTVRVAVEREPGQDPPGSHRTRPVGP